MYSRTQRQQEGILAKQQGRHSLQAEPRKFPPDGRKQEAKR